VGPPPYEKFEDFFTRQQYSNPPALPQSDAEKANMAEFYGHLATPPAPDAKYIAIRENIPDQMTVWNNFVEVQKHLFRETWSWEARKLGLKYSMPVFVYQGDMDINTPVAPAREWIADLQAPRKGFDLVVGAGHNTIVFQRELLRMINRDVRPLVVEPARVAKQ
jgi:pimeloyl-ACP methyl ester carboxylesterase